MRNTRFSSPICCVCSNVEIRGMEDILQMVRTNTYRYLHNKYQVFFVSHAFFGFVRLVGRLLASLLWYPSRLCMRGNLIGVLLIPRHG